MDASRQGFTRTTDHLPRTLDAKILPRSQLNPASWRDLTFTTTTRSFHRPFAASPALQQSVQYKRAPLSSNVQHVEAHASCILAPKAHTLGRTVLTVGDRGTSYSRDFYQKQPLPPMSVSATRMQQVRISYEDLVVP